MYTVSCIVPVKDGGMWLRECLDSLLDLELPTDASLQVSVYNDGSTDDTKEILEAYRDLFVSSKIDYVICHCSSSNGVGFAKNRAVQQSSGDFLCFCDADDVFLKCRILRQLHAALTCDDPFMAFVGGQFRRTPELSTARYSNWANSLNDTELRNQIYTSHGPTIVAPTWFISRKLYDLVGGFNESHVTGYPEDLRFFFDALKSGANLLRVDGYVTIYRYHSNCASLDVSEEMIWKLRVEEFKKNVLSKWRTFSIWNAGKEGKRFFKSIWPEYQKKVIAFCDVDSKKIRRGYFEQYDPVARHIIAKVPIVPVSSAVPPVVLCVKLDLTFGVFEKLLAEKNWQEGIDYFHFG